MRPEFSRLIRAAALLALAGCAGGTANPPPPPTYTGYGYGPGGIELADQFHDDAPANRQVSPDQLPLSFVDHEGKPVDLGQYRGKSNVVLVVSRGCRRPRAGCSARSASPRRPA